MNIKILCLLALLIACSNKSVVSDNVTPVEEVPNPDSGVTIIQLPSADVISRDIAPPAHEIESLRIEPANTTISVKRGQSVSVDFHAFAKMQGMATEVEITDRTVFYVPDNYLVGIFPADGKSTFTTRLPIQAGDPAQRGGKLTVRAQAANNHNPVTTVTTTLTVQLVDEGMASPGTLEAKPALPPNPAAAFQGVTDALLGPTLLYPNDGTLFPPNVKALEIHWSPGGKPASLYEVSLKNEFIDQRHYLRCFADPAKYIKGTCVFELPTNRFDVLSETSRGGSPIKLRIQGSNEAGMVGQSVEISIQIASERVDGAVYYWTASNPPRIMRFDFGSQSGLEPVLAPNSLPNDRGVASSGTRCVGCHTLSRDGKRMVATSGDSTQSYLVYLNDLTKPRTANTNWLTVDGRDAPPANQNRLLLSSFSPDGSEFVAVAPSNDTSVSSTQLLFHDSTTGLRKKGSTGSIDLGFSTSFPDWSPDGASIALTRIYGMNSATITFQEGGISILRRKAMGFTLPVDEIVPHEKGKSRYNAAFVPDSSLLLYSESIRQVNDADLVMDAYSDPSAKTWAVSPTIGSTPVFLVKASAAGVADKLVLEDGREPTLAHYLQSGFLMDTFPRPAPFSATHDGHKLVWFTVSSQRRAGAHRYYSNPSVVHDNPTQTLLWMFALDEDKVLAGEDGSYPGFFLPFQDLTSSNHMAAWTQKYVSDKVLPPPPPVPPPPPPPPSPPIY